MSVQLSGPVIRQGKVLEEYDTPFRSYLRSKFEDQLMNNLFTGVATELGAQIESGVTVDEFGRSFGEPAPRLDAETARAKVKEAGVKLDVPDSGILPGLLDALIERKQRQMVLNDAINRSPTGVRSVAGVGASLAAGILDPFNVAAAFIPVVGEARYTAMLARASGALGRAGVRATVGAAEGAVGMAALEPFNVLSHRALQDDYTALDSLTNIAFGAGLGSLLHAGGGALADAIKRPGTMEILQSGQTPLDFHLQPGPTPLDIHLQAGEAPLRIAPADFSGQVRPAAPDIGLTLRGGAARRFTMEQSPAVASAAAQAESTVRATVPLVRGDEFGLTANIADMFGLGQREGLTYKVVGFEDGKVLASRLGPLPPGTKRVTSFDAAEIQKRVSSGEIAVNTKLPVSAAISKGEIAPPARTGAFTMTPEEPPFYSAKATIERTGAPTQEAAMRTAVAQMAQGRVPDVEALIRADPASGLEPSAQPMQDILATAQRQMQPDAVRLADANASAAGTQRLEAAPKSNDLKAAEAELAKVMQGLAERAASIGGKFEGAAQAELKAADEFGKQLDSLADAARAASVCDL